MPLGQKWRLKPPVLGFEGCLVWGSTLLVASCPAITSWSITLQYSEHHFKIEESVYTISGFRSNGHPCGMVPRLSSLCLQDSAQRLSLSVSSCLSPPRNCQKILCACLSKGASAAVNSPPNCSSGLPKVSCSRPEKSQPSGPWASNSQHLVQLCPARLLCPAPTTSILTLSLSPV